MERSTGDAEMVALASDMDLNWPPHRSMIKLREEMLTKRATINTGNIFIHGLTSVLYKPS